MGDLDGAGSEAGTMTTMPTSTGITPEITPSRQSNAKFNMSLSVPSASSSSSPYTAKKQSEVWLSLSIRGLVFLVVLGTIAAGAWYYVVNGPASSVQLYTLSFASVFAQMANGSIPSYPEFYDSSLELTLLTGSICVGFAPVVDAAGRDAFEASVGPNGPQSTIYAANPVMSKSAMIGIWEAPPGFTAWPRTSASTVPQIRAAARPIYFPLMYLAPVTNNERNFLLDVYSDPIRRAAIDNSLRFSQAYSSDLYYTGGRPAAAVVQPLLAGQSRTLIGITHVELLFEQILADAGPGIALGIDVAVLSPTGLAFTYRLTDAYPVVRGAGIIFDAGMAGYAQTATASLGTTWRFVVAPTQAYYSSFFTSNSRDVIVIVIVCTAAVMCLFVVYDYIVSTHALRLTRAVEATTRIIDDVFPSTVTARLIKDDIEAREGSLNFKVRAFNSLQAQTPSARTSIRGINTSASLVAEAVPPSPGEPVDKGRLSKDGIIADRYDAVTILFSDICSFTDWSAAQEPERVFELLETLFNAFDAAAKANGVFKVETIGDAYVCCAGCPSPSEWHAAQIGDMALAMQAAMETVRVALNLPELRVRIGINSGPITAGVIRAANKRFQLFGDTMNFASRMESTGLPDRIQISEATFHELEACGTHVLEERGVVNVKGKGDVRTWWLTGVAPGRDIMGDLWEIQAPGAPTSHELPAGATAGAIRPQESLGRGSVRDGGVLSGSGDSTGQAAAYLLSPPPPSLGCLPLPCLGGAPRSAPAPALGPSSILPLPLPRPLPSLPLSPVPAPPLEAPRDPGRVSISGLVIAAEVGDSLSPLATGASLSSLAPLRRQLSQQSSVGAGTLSRRTSMSASEPRSPEVGGGYRSRSGSVTSIYGGGLSPAGSGTLPVGFGAHLPRVSLRKELAEMT